MNKNNNYNEESIKTLEWIEHIRLRPGMYIGKTGDGKDIEDGIYVLLKEVIDNSIDEYVMGFGKKIEIYFQDKQLIVRDYGRGIPLGKLLDCVSKINTGAKYDSSVFKKSVGLNGVGLKAVNALSQLFLVESFRNNQMKTIQFSCGELVKNNNIKKTDKLDGTKISFIPDSNIFESFEYNIEHIKEKLWNYVYLNCGLEINFNKEKFHSKNGLKDFLIKKMDIEHIVYDIIHIYEPDLEICITHTSNYNEEYFSFANGQFTPQGGTHLVAFKESIVKTIKEFYNKDFNPKDIKSGISCAISIRIQDPIFESQTKTKLGSTHIAKDKETIRTYINNFIKLRLDDVLHKNPKIADMILNIIKSSEKERKEIESIKKIRTKKTKLTNIHNKKLRDCKFHFNDIKTLDKDKIKTSLFITEGDSASGSITKTRSPKYQAVFSLKGKPLNCYGMKKKVVYENEEFYLLQHALNIEESIDNLRYNKIILATDSDVDGMHIRLLLLTFFLQFFPELVIKRHLYILETPLFRVRNSKETIYFYNDNEKDKFLQKKSGKYEVTRFKGLGEISPNEFKNFIDENMRLIPVLISHDDKNNLSTILEYYMGKNTNERQKFIIDNLNFNLQ